MGSSHLDKLFSDLFAYQQQSSNDLPPVHLWNPPLSGDIDIVIDREGRWFHEGDEIKRASLVKLFTSILTCEGDQYFLVTPVEKWRIKVDVAPLFAISASRELRAGVQAICLTTLTGDTVVVDRDHPVFIDPESELPMLKVRANLTALISRNIYYQLVDWAIEAAGDNSSEQGLYLSSMGEALFTWSDFLDSLDKKIPAFSAGIFLQSTL